MLIKIYGTTSEHGGWAATAPQNASALAKRGIGGNPDPKARQHVLCRAEQPECADALSPHDAID